MQIHQKMDIRGTQQLMMSPRMQQSIGLLQLSLNELEGFLQSMVDENPFLNLESPAVISGAMAQNASQAQSTTHRHDDDSSGDYLASIKEHISLKKHIHDQLNFMSFEGVDYQIACVLIDALAPSGYLSQDLSTLSQQLNVRYEHIRGVLDRLQQCEPVGVFATNPTECFALQLKDQGLFSPTMGQFLNVLDQLPQLGLQRLCQKFNIPFEEGQRCLEHIKRMNPKPGLAFDAEPFQTGMAEIIVHLQDNHQWVATLNADVIPKLFVDMDYADIVKIAQKDTKKTQAYVKERVDHAQWLSHALAQRYVNTQKIAQAIVDFQQDFLTHGITALKPMALKDIASHVGVHESTVSRITTAKYMHTPRGTFELKFFFSSRLQQKKPSGSIGLSQFNSMNKQNDATQQNIQV
ncbi:MAG: RNA polymerase factor sigma-54, partial [Alphaproteobacteria bacterium]|nr:RNA polymerase factor sigma-54 [Alphaproteobacteria bacterium]